MGLDAFQKRTVHQIVVHFVRKGMKPSAIAFYIDYGYECFIAFMSGRPAPKPYDDKFQFRRKPQPSDNRPAEEKEAKSNDESSKQSGQ